MPSGYVDIEDPDVCVTIDRWSTPATAYMMGLSGNFRLVRKDYTRGLYRMSGLDDKALFKVPKGHRLPITALEERVPGSRTAWHCWMVDDPPHWRAMEVYAAAAKGPVLCAGLGLGLFQHALARQPAVDYVMTIEREAAVIDLVNHQLPHPLKDLRIVEGDWRGVMSADLAGIEEDWGMIFVDLWVTSNLREKYEALGDAAQMAVKLRDRWPNALIVFHGFTPLSDVKWDVSEKTWAAMRQLGEVDAIIDGVRGPMPKRRR